MKKAKYIGLLWLVALLGVLSSRAWGQSTQGSILGNVTDPTGAFVPGAQIEAKNEMNNFIRKTTSNEEGFYIIERLEPGPYSLSLELGGFKKVIRNGLQLLTNGQVRMDFQLEVAQTSEQVTVEAVIAPVIETETGQIGQVFDRKMNVHTAVTGTSQFSLILATPGAFWTGTNYAIQGQRGTQTGYSMDGIDTTRQRDGAMDSVFSTNNETAAELRVSGVNNSAEYQYGGMILQTGRSGGNQYHAEANYIFNASYLNARPTYAAMRPRSISHNYFFGGSGPVYIPGLYNGKDKTFFYFNREESKSPAGSSVIYNVPTNAMRGGDFSAFSTPVIDPVTGQSFPGNIIPTARLNAASLRYLQRFYPTANAGNANSPNSNFNGVWRADLGTPLYTFRVDQKVSERMTVWYRLFYSIQKQHQDDNALPTEFLGFHYNDQRNGNQVLATTYTFSPTIVNETRLGFVRIIKLNGNSNLDGAAIVSQIGLTGYPAAVPAGTEGIPKVSIAGLLGMTSRDFNRGTDNWWDFRDTLSISRGAHAIKTGGQFLHAFYKQIPTSPTGQLGSFNFDGSFTGTSFADFLLGIPRTASRTDEVGAFYARKNYISGFFQDDYKVRPNFTLNLGIRYEFGSPYSEETDRIYNFDPVSGSLVVPNSTVAARRHPRFPSNIPIITADQAGFPTRTLIANDKNNIAPRFAFAWRTGGKMDLVVRGGYGIFYSLESRRAFTRQASGPFVGSETFDNAIVNGQARFAWPTAFPASAGSVTAFGTQDINAVGINLRDSYNQQWNLTLEKQIGANGLRVSYLGSTVIHLPYTRNLNQPLPSTTPFNQNLRPYPLYRNITMVDTGGTQSIQSLQMQWTRRVSNGLTMDSHYTWSKNLTDSYDFNALGGQIQNAYDRRADRGNEETQPRHRWVTNFVYDLPFGKGRKYLGNSNKVAQAILGGWVTSHVIVFTSGGWYTPIFTGRDTSNTNVVSGRPDRSCDGNKSNPTTESWFDASCFSRPAAGIGRFGNSGMNIIQGPSQPGWNVRLFKYIPITERLRFRLEGTFYNVINHPINGFTKIAYGGDAALNIISPSVGRIFTNSDQNGITSASRTIVVGMKLEF